MEASGGTSKRRSNSQLYGSIGRNAGGSIVYELDSEDLDVVREDHVDQGQFFADVATESLVL